MKRHGAGKDLMTMRKHGGGKDLMTVKKHGGGKDLMTMKKHGGGKDLMAMKKHGGGKGLMTVWRATNPDADARDFLVDMGLANGEVAHVSRKPQIRSRRLQQQKTVPVSIILRSILVVAFGRFSDSMLPIQKQGRLQSKLQEKRKRFVKRREVIENLLLENVWFKLDAVATFIFLLYARWNLTNTQIRSCQAKKNVNLLW